MIDYISLYKSLCKDSLFLGYCKHTASYNNGWDMYHLEGCEKLEIWYNGQFDMLKVRGSLPYFLKGHNFTFTTAELVQAVDCIDTLLGGVGLWDSMVEKFENGAIVPVDLPPKEYIANHFAEHSTQLKSVVNEKYGGRARMWHRAGEDIKLYDAGANILLKQDLSRRQAIQQAGWNPSGNYVKFEIRYSRPELINYNRPVRLELLQNKRFIDMLDKDIIMQYQLLTPAKGLIIPADKKDFSTIDAVLFAYVSYFLNIEARPLEEAKKQIYSLINQAECLSKADKDARKLQVKRAFDKLEVEPQSKWDITEKLEAALKEQHQ